MTVAVERSVGLYFTLMVFGVVFGTRAWWNYLVPRIQRARRRRRAALLDRELYLAAPETVAEIDLRARDELLEEIVSGRRTESTRRQRYPRG